MDYRNKLKTSRQTEYQLRCASAYNNSHGKFYTDFNDDVTGIPYFRGCFTKSLPHNSNGKVCQEEVVKVLKGVRTCKCYFEQIRYGGNLRLVNPSCIYSWELVGPFKSSLEIPPVPSVKSAQVAGEMIELYIMALLRDVPFNDYETHPEVARAIKELNNLTDFAGPIHGGRITPQTLFRGNSNGDLNGFYVSQFLLHPFSHGISDQKQKYRCDQAFDYMTSWETSLSVQNGIVKEVAPDRFDRRHITNLRDGCTYVHLDDSLQAGLYASLILNSLKCPKIVPDCRSDATCKSTAGPNKVKETMLVDLGGLDLHFLMSEAIRVSMLSAWYHKWNILRIRPEALSMEIHRTLTEYSDRSEYGLHHDLLSSNVLKRVFDKYNSYLLPQAYPEGSPCHPAYPAGHATFIGAVITILKAFFDENFMIDAYGPNKDGSKLIPLGYKVKVGDELDKLASNIALFRNAAGINYRSDLIGIELGETIAIKILEEAIHRYTYDVSFKFHRYNGQFVEISN